jgi:hypothetical protein
MIKTGHFVKSAEGNIYYVNYAAGEEGELQEIELKEIIDGKITDIHTYLTVGELKRIPNPFQGKLPPIEGMPAERPVCAYCGRRMQPITDHQREHGKGWGTGRIIRRVFKFWKAYPTYRDPIFDTKECALKFAVAAHRAGYRIVRKA